MIKRILLTLPIFVLFLPGLFAQANLTLIDCYTLKASLEELNIVSAGTYSFVLEKEIMPQLWQKITVVDSEKQKVLFTDLPKATYRVTIVSPNHQKTKQTKIYHHLMKEDPQSIDKANTFLSNKITLTLDSNCDFGRNNEVSIKSRNGITSPIRIYPNPSQNKVWVEWRDYMEIMQISIYSIAGIRLKHITSADKRVEVDVSDIPPGIYLVKATNKEAMVFTQRISIIR